MVDESQDGGAWLVLGCAQYRRSEKMMQIKSSVTAELQNNEWFFSEIGSAIQIDGPEERCSIPEQPPRPHGRTADRSSSRCSATSGKKDSDGWQR
jgi:hypothetical protein